MPKLIPAAVDAVLTIVNAIIENLPLLIEAAVQMVSTLIQGIPWLRDSKIVEAKKMEFMPNRKEFLEAMENERRTKIIFCG